MAKRRTRATVNRRRKSTIRRLPPIQGGREHATTGLHPVDKATLIELARAENCTQSYMLRRLLVMYIGTAEDE